MNIVAKILIIAGTVLIASGILLAFHDRIPFLGRLPGDIVVKRDGFRLYVPIVSGLVLSVFFSLLFWLISYLKNR